MPPSSPGVARQRLMTAAAGLGVAALAAAAFVLSYDDLRVLALAGDATKRYAPVYPTMIDTLVVVTILSLVVARRTRWWARGVRWLLLLVLLAGAAAASTQRAVKGYDPLPDKWLSAGVAVAPWVLLLIAAWLWLSMFRQARLLFARPGAGARDRAGGMPPTGTVRVVPTRSDEAGHEAGHEAADPIIPGFDAPPNVPAGGPVNVPTTLPTDIKLVTHRPAAPVSRPQSTVETGRDPGTETTQPDLVMPRRGHEADPADTDGAEDGTVAADRAEDPDADGPAVTADRTVTDPTDPADPADPGDGEDEDDVERWSTLAAEDAERWAHEAADHFSGAPQPDPAPPAVEWIPPASRFRSSPTPPRD